VKFRTWTGYRGTTPAVAFDVTHNDARGATVIDLANENVAVHQIRSDDKLEIDRERTKVEVDSYARVMPSGQ